MHTCRRWKKVTPELPSFASSVQIVEEARGGNESPPPRPAPQTTPIRQLSTIAPLTRACPDVDVTEDLSQKYDHVITTGNYSEERGINMTNGRDYQAM